MGNDRLGKLASNLDRRAEQDLARLRQEDEIERMRRKAASQMHGWCLELVDGMNQRLHTAKIDLSPGQFEEEHFRQGSMNLFQINAAGRVIQISFQVTEPLVSTESLSVPYTLEGAVRWFNREMLEGDELREHQLYYVVDRGMPEWRFYDLRTHRMGRVNTDYLIGLLEQIV